ncbi:MAG: head-tail adaptor protein [Chloroflexia bacterium]|nr:head-tail adaptor protein [Chloroflexia bacterium]
MIGTLSERILIYKRTKVWDAINRTHDYQDVLQKRAWSEVKYINEAQIVKEDIIIHMHDVEFKIYYDKFLTEKDHFIKFEDSEYTIEGIKPIARQWSVLKCKKRI